MKKKKKPRWQCNFVYNALFIPNSTKPTTGRYLKINRKTLTFHLPPSESILDWNPEEHFLLTRLLIRNDPPIQPTRATIECSH